MTLKLYNTLSRKKETFKPLHAKQVGYYTCGPTVYWFQHLGTFRTYVLEDVFKRILKHDEYNVKHVRNYTDVGHLTSDSDEGEDKMDLAAKREGKNPKEIADYYIKDFEETEQLLNIEPPDVKCRATEHIKEIQELIKRIEKNGFTYTTSTGVFFDTSKFKNYGILEKRNVKGQKQGAREEVIIDREKKNPSDFALWFINKPEHIMQWDSPWGKGYPGWHVECSAMSMKYLGEQLDIHTGGIEHIPIHHTNEIAQSESATGKQFVKYWVHLNWLLFAGDKMAKSSGKIIRPKNLFEKGYSPKQVRYFLLSGAHYRTALNYTEENLQKSVQELKKINEFVQRLYDCNRKEASIEKELKAFRKEFFKKLNDDFNIPVALNLLFEFIKKTNSKIDSGKIGKKDPEKIIELLKEIDSVLKVMSFEKAGKGIPAEILALAKQREEARSAKDWKKSDELRKQLQEKGYRIDDTAEGPKVRKIE